MDLSFLGESLRTICVPPVTRTGPGGIVETTVKVDLLPIRAMFGTMMSVPATRGLAMSPLRKISSIPFSNLIFFPSGMLGASTTCSAISGSQRLTFTFSSTLTPALVLVSPSMKIMPLPSSSGSHLKTLATTVLFPTISIVSPMSSPRALRDSVSILARPYPASDCLWAMPTLRTMDSVIGRRICLAHHKAHARARAQD